MLTKITVANFKRFEHFEIDLGDLVVFVGPNNSGKTTALQALAFWYVGLKIWNERRKGKEAPEKRPGVTINRRDLVSLAVPKANLLWKDLHTRDIQKYRGKPKTKNVRIEIVVEGVQDSKVWKCGLEFDYANEESFYCRPLRLSEKKNPERMVIPAEVEGIKVAFLPPMSGLAANETRLDPGAINVRFGEGRTAEILRNLCYQIFNDNQGNWKKLVNDIKRLFGSELEEPQYIPERGEITLNYREEGISLDLSSSGRGLQQTLLLLAYMYANPSAVLLIDEPDAHLEILRQRQVYQLLSDLARDNNNQIIAASHSEILLNEAADRDVVIAFVGKPHRLNDRGSQVLKSLKEIGFEHYYQAQQTGWVLYLEGSTDLAILRAFAERLNYEDAKQVLERPFIHYVGNKPSEVNNHFYGLREACPNLLGVAIFDKLDPPPKQTAGITFLLWARCEIENYLCNQDTLINFAITSAKEETPGELFTKTESERRVQAMTESIDEVEKALAVLGKGSPWGHDTKVSDEFLTPLFEKYYEKLSLPNLMLKKNFHVLANYIKQDNIDPEIKVKLEAIVEIASKAKPLCE